jgi:hypothetical protein
MDSCALVLFGMADGMADGMAFKPSKPRLLEQSAVSSPVPLNGSSSPATTLRRITQKHKQQMSSRPMTPNTTPMASAVDMEPVALPTPMALVTLPSCGLSWVTGTSCVTGMSWGLPGSCGEGGGGAGHAKS